MPHRSQQGRLLRRLAARAGRALLPPQTTTPRALAIERATALPRAERERRLALAELQRTVSGGADRWRRVAELLRLFDAMPDAIAAPDAEDARAFAAARDAWRGAGGAPDAETLYRKMLRDDTLTRPDERVFLCGFERLSDAEDAWARRLEARGALTRVAEEIDPGAPLERALDAVFAQDAPLATRIARTREALPASPLAAGGDSPAPGSANVGILEAPDFETHARGIALQILDWRRAGIADIAIVTQDRKLARRLRATLEEHNIGLADATGWALSTAAAATTLAALLPAGGLGAEQLLALARSPFCARPRRGDADCDRLERALTATTPFPDTLEQAAEIDPLARELAGALAPLTALEDGQERAHADHYDALARVMHDLGIDAAFARDRAGARLLEVLHETAQAARATGARGGRRAWRRWLLHEIEHENFVPEAPAGGARLYNFRQAALLEADALVVAALDARHAPPPSSPLVNDRAADALGLPSRKTLREEHLARLRALLRAAPRALLTWQKHDDGRQLTPLPWLVALERFHSLAWGASLQRPDLIARARDAARAVGPGAGLDAGLNADLHAGQHAPPDAGLDMGADAGRRASPDAGPDADASGNAVPDAGLNMGANASRHAGLNADAGMDACGNAGAGAGPDADPRLATQPAPAARLPQRISASHCQAAVDCPYQFFAKTLLRLRPADEPRTALNAADFGRLVHDCMERLVAEHPAPDWRAAQGDDARRDALHRAGLDIVKREMAPYLSVHQANRDRLRRAQELIACFIDALLELPGFGDAELAAEQNLAAEIGKPPAQTQLVGRIDLRAGDTVIDFKTGKLPSYKAIDNGEDVQLACYALLHPATRRVLYLGAKDAQATQASLDGDQLRATADNMRARLAQFLRDLQDGRPLPAWGADTSCRYCDYEGLCRRPAWLGRAAQGGEV